MQVIYLECLDSPKGKGLVWKNGKLTQECDECWVVKIKWIIWYWVMSVAVFDPEMEQFPRFGKRCRLNDDMKFEWWLYMTSHRRQYLMVMLSLDIEDWRSCMVIMTGRELELCWIVDFVPRTERLPREDGCPRASMIAREWKLTSHKKRRVVFEASSCAVINLLDDI